MGQKNGYAGEEARQFLLDLSSAQDKLDELIDSMKGEVETLKVSWNSSAADIFYEFMNQVGVDANSMIVVLENAKNWVETTCQNYNTADYESERAFQELYDAIGR